MGGSSRVATSYYLKKRHKKNQQSRAHTQREKVVNRNSSAVSPDVKLTRQVL